MLKKLFNLKKQKKEEKKKTNCPCCENMIDSDLIKDITMQSVLNNTDTFFDLVDICPHCGCTLLFPQEVNNWMEDSIHSEIYNNIKNNKELYNGYKNWLLYAIMNDDGGNYDIAGLSYLKLYDYMEFKNAELEFNILEHAALCFWEIAKSKNSFAYAYIAIDCKRRIKKYEEADRLILQVSKLYNQDNCLSLLNLEKKWIEDKDYSKKKLDVNLKL